MQSFMVWYTTKFPLVWYKRCILDVKCNQNGFHTKWSSGNLIISYGATCGKHYSSIEN